MSDFSVLTGMLDTAASVGQALLPLLALFVIFQIFYLRLPWGHVLNLLKGSLIAAVGLFLFLHGVLAVFSPVGQAIGGALGDLRARWLLVPFGFFMGYLAIRGEPAVRVLSEQVERASGGSIRGNTVLHAVGIGVAAFVALAMARVAYGIPLAYIVVPGYLLALVMVWFSDSEYLSIAFDAGGVATGPMSSALLLAITIGVASSSEGRDTLVDGFGVVALVALAPVLSVMTLGMFIRMKRGRVAHKPGAEADSSPLQETAADGSPPTDNREEDGSST